MSEEYFIYTLLMCTTSLAAILLRNIDTNLKEQIEKMGTVAEYHSGSHPLYTGYTREGERPCQREK